MQILIIANWYLLLEILHQGDTYLCALVAPENVGYERCLNLHLYLREFSPK